jgi:hypothetical protein
MVTQVNGNTRAGEFLTGNMEFYTVWTMVPVTQTNVRSPLNDVLKALNATTLSSTKSITVKNGSDTDVTYVTDETYEDALAKQSNLDALIRVFSIRANPVIVSVSSAAITDGNAANLHPGASNALTFGDNYSGARTEYTVRLVAEKANAWNVSTAVESNANGYQLLTALEGVAVTDLDTPVVLGTDAFLTGSTNDDRNTLAIKSDALN